MMFRLIALICAWLLAGSHAWTQVITPPPAYRTSPGYPTGRFYPTGNQLQQTTVAVPTLDTVVFVYPFTVFDDPLVATSLNVRTVTGVASCAVKMAIWATGATTKRPTGTPIVASNTGQNCAVSGTNQTIAINFTFQPGVVYWAGTAVTTGASQFIAGFVSEFGNGVAGLLGRTAVGSGVDGLSAPYAYATDITTLDLTAASFTDVTSGGIPVIYIGN